MPVYGRLYRHGLLEKELDAAYEQYKEGCVITVEMVCDRDELYLVGHYTNFEQAVRSALAISDRPNCDRIQLTFTYTEEEDEPMESY